MVAPGLDRCWETGAAGAGGGRHEPVAIADVVILAIEDRFAVEGAIIDIDHWRHYFLILGALWGLMVASRPYLVVPANRSGARPTF